jgi:hypothetical protein
VKIEDLLALVIIGFLREKEMDLWCVTTGDPYPMENYPDEISMVTQFLERGLTLPANDFFPFPLLFNFQHLCYCLFSS